MSNVRGEVDANTENSKQCSVHAPLRKKAKRNLTFHQIKEQDKNLILLFLGSNNPVLLKEPIHKFYFDSLEMGWFDPQMKCQNFKLKFIIIKLKFYTFK